jgi:hypothetical protein
VALARAPGLALGPGSRRRARLGWRELRCGHAGGGGICVGGASRAGTRVALPAALHAQMLSCRVSSTEVVGVGRWASGLEALMRWGPLACLGVAYLC